MYLLTTRGHIKNWPQARPHGYIFMHKLVNKKYVSKRFENTNTTGPFPRLLLISIVSYRWKHCWWPQVTSDVFAEFNIKFHMFPPRIAFFSNILGRYTRRFYRFHRFFFGGGGGIFALVGNLDLFRLHITSCLTNSHQEKTVTIRKNLLRVFNRILRSSSTCLWAGLVKSVLLAPSTHFTLKLGRII